MKQFTFQERTFLFFTTLLFFIVGLKYFFSNSVFIYDGAAHLHSIWYLKNYLWPNFSGWNPFTLLGYDQGLFYPSLFHWLASGLSFIVGIEPAVKILIGVSLMSLPLSLYLLFKKLSSNFEISALATSLAVVIFLVTPGFLGANLHGLFYIGLLPSIFSLPVLFFYLKSLFNLEKGKWLVPSLLLASLILLHLVVAEVAVLFLFCLLVTKFFQGKLQLSFLWHLLSSFALTSFFWLPFLLNSSLLTTSLHPLSFGSVNLFLLVVILGSLLFVLVKNKKRLLFFHLSLLIIVALIVVDFLSNRFFFTRTLFYNLHLYRLQIYLYLSSCFLFSAALVVVKTKLTRKFTLLFVLSPVILGVGYLLYAQPFPNPEKAVLKESLPGRFIETYTQGQSRFYEYALQTELTREKKLPWAYGLFTDGSPNGPFLGSLVFSLSGQIPAARDKNFLEKKVLDLALTEKRLALFGINNLLQQNKCGGKEVAKINSPRVSFTMEKVNSLPLVSLPAEFSLVETNWQQQVLSWWNDKKAPEILIKTKKGLKADEVKIDQNAQVKISANNSNWSQFTVVVSAEEKVPVLVKFTFLPGWHAYQNGQEITIYQASPDLMLINATGTIEFIYKELPEQTWTKMISFLTLLFLGLIMVKKIYETKKTSGDLNSSG